MVLMSGRHIMATASIPLEVALVDETERLTGSRKTGSFAAIKSLMSAPLLGVQTYIFMWVIAAYGYDQDASTQNDSAQLGIQVATCRHSHRAGDDWNSRFSILGLHQAR